MIRGVLIDALGTLVRLEPPAPRLQASLRARRELEVSLDRCEAGMQAEMRYYAAHCARARDAAALAALRLECADVLADVLAAGANGAEILPCLTDAISFTAFPDAAPALAALSTQGRRLAVVSNWDVSLPPVLARLGLAARFEVIVHSAGSRRRQARSAPLPDRARAALARAGRVRARRGRSRERWRGRKRGRTAGDPRRPCRRGRARQPRPLAGRGAGAARSAGGGLSSNLDLPAIQIRRVVVAFAAYVLVLLVAGGLVVILSGKVPGNRILYDPWTSLAGIAAYAALVAGSLWAAEPAGGRLALGLRRPDNVARAVGLALLVLVLGLLAAAALEPLLHGARSQGLTPRQVPRRRRGDDRPRGDRGRARRDRPVRGGAVLPWGAHGRAGAARRRFTPFATAALFAAAHLELRAFAALFILGVLLAWLYARTRSILPGVGVHAANNLLALLAALFMK